MKRLLFILLVIFFSSCVVLAQTETPTVPISPHIFATVESGQMTRFDYVASAAQVYNNNLLEFLLFSVWGMFLFFVFVFIREQRS